MDAASDPEITEIWVMKSAQVGWTEILGNIVGYHVEQDPAPILLVQPTLEIGHAWSKDRLAPMVRDTPCLRGLIKDPRSRDSGNTLLHKTFPGGHITIGGANSPAGLASRPIRIVLFDEVDRFPASAGSEGDPINLGKKRSQTFWNRKIMGGSTPTVKGVSRIEMAYEQSDMREFWVPCPHCDEFQVLRFAQITWPEGKPEKATYACEHCGSCIDDSQKLSVLRQGEWRAQREAKGVAGFWIWEGYSPWSTWGEIATGFVNAKATPETLQTFVNTVLAETWEEAGEEIDEKPLLARREDYETEIPEGVLCITAYADVQDNRLEIEFVGWGENEESWGLDYVVLYGDPTMQPVWDDLDEQLKRTFQHPSGAILPVSAAGIDSGYQSKMVYSFAQPRRNRRIYATKGKAGADRPVVSAPRRMKLDRRRSFDLFTIGTDEAKRILMARLSVSEPGPGYCHFPRTYDEEYFAQITAESCRPKRRRGMIVGHEWVKTRPRNEALDVRIGNLAMVKVLNPNWQRLKRQVAREKPAPEPVRQPSPAEQIQKQRAQRLVRPPRAGSWVTKW